MFVRLRDLKQFQHKKPDQQLQIDVESVNVHIPLSFHKFVKTIIQETKKFRNKASWVHIKLTFQYQLGPDVSEPMEYLINVQRKFLKNIHKAVIRIISHFKHFCRNRVIGEADQMIDADAKVQRLGSIIISKITVYRTLRNRGADPSRTGGTTSGPRRRTTFG